MVCLKSTFEKMRVSKHEFNTIFISKNQANLPESSPPLSLLGNKDTLYYNRQDVDDFGCVGAVRKNFNLCLKILVRQRTPAVLPAYTFPVAIAHRLL